MAKIYGNTVGTFKSGGEIVVLPSKFNQLINGTLTEVTAEDLAGSTKVNDYAFFKQRYLERVDFPPSLKELGEYSFWGCENLTEVNFTNIVLLKARAFNASGLKQFIQLSTCIIDGTTFTSSPKLEIVAVGNTINPILSQPHGVFEGCTGLKFVKFNEGVQETGLLFTNGIPQSCIFDFPTTILKIAGITSKVKAYKFVVIRATIPPTLTASNNMSTATRFVPYESIEDYKVATNWSANADYIYPFVYNLEDLANIDTSKYTKALHIIDKDAVSVDNYAIYNYTNGEWVKEAA